MSRALYLRVDDEESSTFKLHGTNDCQTVKMNGWTNNIPIEFPGLRVDLNVRTEDLQSWHSSTPRDSRNLKNLKHYERKAQSGGAGSIVLFDPIYVAVLGKRSIQAFEGYGNGKLLVLGDILVGDDSGFCVLKAVNNAIQTLYEQVNVGDRLYIGGGVFEVKRNSRFGLPTFLDDSRHLNLELKVTPCHSRDVLRLININSYNIEKGFLGGRRLWIPSSLGFDLDSHTAASFTDCFDIMGVVSHAGRIERLWNWRCKPKVEKYSIQDGLFHKEIYETYTAFRWLEMVDADTQAPLPVTLFINNSTWSSQDKITPGSAIVITNVRRAKKSYWYPKLESSVFSQIYVNDDLDEYFKIVEGIGENGNVSKEFFSSDSARMKEILERKDIKWSAGGLYAQPFASEIEFCRFFNHEYSEMKSRRPRTLKLPFVRREGQRVHFKGTIVKYRAFNGVTTLPLWTSKDKKLDSEYHDYRKYHCKSPFFGIGNWYAFTQELPMPNLDSNDIPDEDRSNIKTRFNTVAYDALRRYCEPLLMPHGTDMSLKDLPLIDGPPYYWVMIADRKFEKLYTCLWKPSRHLTFDQMTIKLELARERIIIGMIDIHCVDDRAIESHRYEVFLQDFVTLTTDIAGTSREGEEGQLPGKRPRLSTTTTDLDGNSKRESPF